MSSSQSLRERTAAEIRAEMGRQRRSATELVSLLNLSQQSISRRLRGETDISLDHLEVIAEWLGVSVPDLIPTRAVA